jgi:hypothetical protein
MTRTIRIAGAVALSLAAAGCQLVSGLSGYEVGAGGGTGTGGNGAAAQPRLVWSKQLDEDGATEVRDVAQASSPQGSLLAVAGVFKGTLLAGESGPLEASYSGDGYRDAFVLSLDPANGSVRWGAKLTATGDSKRPLDLAAVATDGESVFVCGSFDGALIGGKVPVGTNETGAIYVARLSAGETKWVTGLLGPESGVREPRDIAVDDDGVYVAGAFLGAFHLDKPASDQVLSTLNRDGFVLKLDKATGDSVGWAHSIGGPKDGDEIMAIATRRVADEDRVLLFGAFEDSVSWNNDGGELRKLGESAGALLLEVSDESKQPHSSQVLFDGSGSEKALRVAAAGKTIAVAGTFDGDLTDPISVSSGPGKVNLFGGSLDNEANELFEATSLKAFGAEDKSQESGGVAAVSSDDSVVLTGGLRGAVDFDQVHVPAFGLDFFTVKLDSKGRVQWATALGGDGDQRGIAVAVDQDRPTYYYVANFGQTFDLVEGTVLTADAGGPDALVLALEDPAASQ